MQGASLVLYSIGEDADVDSVNETVVVIVVVNVVVVIVEVVVVVVVVVVDVVDGTVVVLKH